MNWNLFADQILRQGEAAFRQATDAAGIEPKQVDALIAAEEARQRAARTEEIAASLEAAGVDVSDLAKRIEARVAEKMQAAQAAEVTL